MRALPSPISNLFRALGYLSYVITSLVMGEAKASIPPQPQAGAVRSVRKLQPPSTKHEIRGEWWRIRGIGRRRLCRLRRLRTAASPRATDLQPPYIYCHPCWQPTSTDEYIQSREQADILRLIVTRKQTRRIKEQTHVPGGVKINRNQ